MDGCYYVANEAKAPSHSPFLCYAHKHDRLYSPGITRPLGLPRCRSHRSAILDWRRAGEGPGREKTGIRRVVVGVSLFLSSGSVGWLRESSLAQQLQQSDTIATKHMQGKGEQTARQEGRRVPTWGRQAGPGE